MFSCSQLHKKMRMNGVIRSRGFSASVIAILLLSELGIKGRAWNFSTDYSTTRLVEDDRRDR